MAAKPILPYPHPLLRQRSQEIPAFDAHAKKLLEHLQLHLRKTLRACGGPALSAVQIGAPWRVILVTAKLAGNELLLVNPVLEAHGSLFQHHVESCASTPGINVDIQRWAMVDIVARDIRGDHFRVQADSVLAQVLQHELNHLDGKPIVECAKLGKRRFLTEKLEPLGGARGALLDYDAHSHLRAV